MTHHTKLKIVMLGVVMFLFLEKPILHAQTGDIYNESWALLVGINKYKHLPANLQLRFAVNDVTAMRESLIQHFGFRPDHITTLTDAEATKSAIADALSQFADTSKIKENHRVLIYFSGHGQTVKLPNGKEMGFLITHDADIKLTDTGNPAYYYRTCLGMDELRRLSNMIPAKHVLFLVDACYSGLATRSIRALPTNLPNYLKTVVKLPARQIITAGLGGEQVFEEGGHGIFTARLLAALEHGLADQNPPDNVTTGTELANYLQGIVAAYSDGKQHPHFGRFDGEGEFIFQHSRDDVAGLNPAPTVDQERPQIHIIKPIGIQKTRSFAVEPSVDSIELVGLATDNIGVVSVRINGRPVPTTTVSKKVLDLMILPSPARTAVRFEKIIDIKNNAQEIEIQATDAAGNSEVIYLQFGIQRPDTEKPTIEITEPAGLAGTKRFEVEGLSETTSLRLAGIARDNVGVTQVTVNGRTVRTTAMGAGAVKFETTIDFSALLAEPAPIHRRERSIELQRRLWVSLCRVQFPPLLNLWIVRFEV